MIGTSINQYQIAARLGAGGMGEVYRATDTRLGREVAIKVLPPAVSRDPQSLVRFDSYRCPSNAHCRSRTACVRPNSVSSERVSCPTMV